MLIPCRFLGRAFGKQNRLFFSRQNDISTTLRKQASRQSPSTDKSEPKIPCNLLKDTYSASYQSENGKIYDKKPFKMRLDKDTTYSWCLCGHSKSQPICDGSHRNPYIKITQRPIRFKVEETKEYWLCNCKQTSNRPFCDGTHKRADIQEAIK